MKFVRGAFLYLLTNLAVLAMGAVVVLALGYFGIDVVRVLGVGWEPLVIFSLLYGFGGSFFSLLISRWVAKKFNGVRLLEESRLLDYTDKERVVYVAVANVAKANGIRMPEVGTYSSAEPNAFATGPSKNSALVCVSTGLLAQMSAAEIEGVVAHEMAHVLNGDMVTMTLLQGVLNAFVIFFSQVLAWAASRALARDGERGSYLVSYLLRFLLEIALGVVATLILMAFSRWREYRADAGGAQYAGRDKMIAGLRKLKAIVEKGVPAEGPSGVPAGFGINGKQQSTLMSLFSSHPPLEKRIARLEQNYFVR